MKFKIIVIIELLLVLFFSLSLSGVYARTGKVKANGIMIAYESFGKTTDPTIILINSTGAPMTDWPLEFCEKLARQSYQVIRFDNRDVGLSGQSILVS